MKVSVWGVLILFLLAPSVAVASRPVERTLTGCVLENRFYSVYPDHAYLIKISPPLDLTAYEGKTVSMKGLLYPGDTFAPQAGSLTIVNDTCSAQSRKSINGIFLVRYRIQALDMAKKGRFTDALAMMTKAFEIDGRACDSYTDRAQVYCLMNNFDGAEKDLAVLKNNGCTDPKRANYLLLEDLGQCLEGKGRNRGAFEAYRLALESCITRGSGLCREPIEKRIKNLPK